MLLTFLRGRLASAESRRRILRAHGAALSLTLAASLGSSVLASGKGKHQEPVSSPAAAPAASSVTLIADGQTRTVQTSAKTVSELLKEQNLPFGPQDRASCALSAPVKSGMQVTIERIRVEVATEKTAIPFPTRQVYGKAPVGTKNVLTPGKDGERIVKYRVFYRDNKVSSKEKISEVVASKPRTQIVELGTRGMTLASRGYFAGRRIVEMVATGYGPGGNGRWGSRTSSGLRPGFGVVAVDPRFIPLGTRLYIEGYGNAVAGDTGGAIKGNRIDLGMDSDSEASRVGRKRVRVLILD